MIVNLAASAPVTARPETSSGAAPAFSINSPAGCDWPTVTLPKSMPAGVNEISRSVPVPARLTNATGFARYYHGDRITTGWDFRNKEGNEVSAGVYLAFCELLFGDGSQTVSEKFKIAVIK